MTSLFSQILFLVVYMEKEHYCFQKLALWNLFHKFAFSGSIKAVIMYNQNA